jgi:hypothetical protein
MGKNGWYMLLESLILVWYQCRKRSVPSHGYKVSFQLRIKGSSASNRRQQCRSCDLNGELSRTGNICLQILPFQSNLNKLCLQGRAYVGHFGNCFASQNSQAESRRCSNAKFTTFRVFPVFNRYVSPQKHNRSNTRVYGVRRSIWH